MDLKLFEELLTPTGQAALSAAEALSPSESTFLAGFERLRKYWPEGLARVALEMAILRLKSQNKFSQGSRMYFTRESLEQASSEQVARHRARRFGPFGAVADLCCGLGSDSLAFAASGLAVRGIDLDPLRLAMARANAAALGLQVRLQFVEGDALTTPLDDLPAAFADPSRRSDNRRYLDPGHYTPTLDAIRGRFDSDFPLAVKIAPGVPWSAIGKLPAEAEFISLAGELKECLLWFGPFLSASRRATLLPDEVSLAANESLPLDGSGQVREYVFDPDPALVRAGLTGNLAAQLGLRSLDFQVALLTGQAVPDSPFLNAYRIEWSAKYHSARLREFLRSHKVGRVTPINRGSRLEVEAIRKGLKLSGDEHRVVIFTRINDEETVLVGERVIRPAGEGLQRTDD